MKKYYKNKGFTFIEIMIVVTIAGILAGIAIPTYQAYIIRTRLVEISHFSAAAKLYIWEEYFTVARMPSNTSESATQLKKIMLESELISNVTYNRIDHDNAKLEVTFQNLGSGADNQTMVFLFTTDGTKIEMDCRGGTLPGFYRHDSCR